MKMYKVAAGCTLSLGPGTAVRLAKSVARDRGHLLTGAQDDGDHVVATTIGHQQFKAGTEIGLAELAKGQAHLVESLTDGFGLAPRPAARAARR